MIRLTWETDKGPMLMLGLTEENLTRLRAGMPIDVDLAPLTPPGKRLRSLVISLHETHRELMEDLKRAGFPVTDEQIAEAKAIDDSL